jgi:hypothetical protein
MKKVYILEHGQTKQTGLIEYYSPEAFTSERKAQKQIERYFTDSQGFNLIKYNPWGDDSILFISFNTRNELSELREKKVVNLRLRELEVN